MSEVALTFHNFSYTYDDGTRALSDVNLSVDSGESVGIIGHNGSGKSTLLTSIVGIIKPHNGVKVFGLTVEEPNIRDIRRLVGYVFQNPRDQLFMSTVTDDVAFGPLNMGMSPQEAMTQTEKALDMVGLRGFGSRIPYHLSGGEMRLASIAAVLAMSPKIIVMDEPSSNLCPRAKRGLAALLNRLPYTKLISSHDLEFIRSCTERIVVLKEGALVADGPTDVILDNSEMLEASGL
ncbi:MAG: energy-coupling factor ABC transporter ATP-binding protein [Syntrophales bacterium LBB04]|nr:energy-coupling factor ABC transporter ATP-binding protein [Syntrophales bacterium LBB04]